MPCDKTELFGDAKKKIQVSSFSLSERDYAPNTRTPMHTHANALFCLVLSGRYSERYGRTMRECLPSTAIFNAFDDPHEEVFHETGGNTFIAEIDRSWVDSLCHEIRLPRNSCNFSTGAIPFLGQRLYNEFQNFDSVSPIIIEGIILEIVGETARQNIRRKHERPIWLGHVESFLRERFRERFSLIEAANFVNIHPVHLAQTFRKFNNTTPGTFVRDLRLEAAAKELRDSRTPVSEIAVEYGFSDQSHFSRHFKRRHGVTPVEFRNRFS